MVDECFISVVGATPGNANRKTDHYQISHRYGSGVESRDMSSRSRMVRGP